MLKKRIFYSTVIFLFFIIVFLPLILVFGSSFKEIGSALSGFNMNSLKEKFVIISNSFAIAFFTSLFSLIIGAPLAFLVSRTNLYFRKIIKSLCIIPFFIPPYIQAYAWIFILGKKGFLNTALMKIFSMQEPIFTIYGIKGVIFVLTLSYFPVVMFLISIGLESTDPTLEDACSLYRSKLGVTRWITFPLVFPYLIAGIIFTFIFAFSQFGVSALLEVRSYSVDLFVQISSFYNESRAALNSLPILLFILFLIIFLSRKWEKGFFAIFITKDKKRFVKLSNWGQALGLIFSLLVIFLSFVIPIGELMFQSRSLKVIIAALKASAKPIITSFLLAFISASLIVILSLILSSLLNKSKFNLSFRIATILPLGIPGSILGLGLIKLWNNELTGFIYSSFLIIIIVYIARFIPYGILALYSNLKQVDNNLQDAAALSGASQFKINKDILIPLLKPGIKFAWVITFILCLGELTSTVLVVPPGHETLSLRIYSLMHYGESSLIAAASLIPLLLSLSGFLFIKIFFTLVRIWR